MPFNRIRPTSIQLEASSICQLRCPSCPTHSGVERPAVGSGFLKLADFQALLRENPRVREIELSNYGEIFLNPDLLGILEFAYERGVALTADNGVNFNRVSDEVLEGLVKYELRSMTCSIDGASEQTYRRYRVNGSFSTVIENLYKLNALKNEYQSGFPSLVWQFVIFGHNEQEVSQARELARLLDMRFYPKLSWDPQLAPIHDRELVRMEVGAADREEYKQRFGLDYGRACCLSLWNRPQINWDGRVLGCSRNFWGDFGASAFTDGLAASVNSPRMRHARKMLLGKKPAADGIPCTTCSLYLDMRAEGSWLQKTEIRAGRRHHARTWPSATVRKSAAWRGARFVYRSFRPSPGPTPDLPSRVYSLRIPLPPDEERGWKSYGVFAGSTVGLRTLSCHVSVLTKDTCPHPPHTHEEEEILMLLAGEVDLVLASSAVPGETWRERLRPGQFVYYPRDCAHTLQTTSEDPANYLMFKWRADSRGTRPALAHGLFETADSDGSEGTTNGFLSRMIFSGPTSYLQKLSCHTSTLAPGGGYAPHADLYDVAIIVLAGEVETLGQRVRPYGVIFYTAGEPHGMHNPGQTVARYVVFEFHRR